MIVKQKKILVPLTLYLSGDSSKHEVHYNHIYQKGLISTDVKDIVVGELVADLCPAKNKATTIESNLLFFFQ